MSEISVQEKASQASVLLGSEVFIDIVASIELSLIEQWKHADNSEDREHYWYKVQALQSVIGDLEACIDSNKIENPIGV
jgi:hypothetical protein